MNRYAVLVFAIVLLSVPFAVLAGLKYSQATLLFGAVALVLAPATIHKVASSSVAVGQLVGLAVFASFPFRKLFQIDGYVQAVAVNFVYLAVLWLVGMGWKRNWKDDF